MHIATQQLLRIALLGVGFFFLFAGYNSLTNMEKTFLLSLHRDVPSFHGDGYVAQSITYCVFALVLWLAPSIISVTGPRLAMFLSAFGYEIFILSLFIPVTWVTYLSSVMAGCMAAILWCGHATYLILNSEPYMVSRCLGLFSAIFQFRWYVVSFFFEDAVLLYSGSVLTGICASLLWTGALAYLVANSSPDLIGRNTGLFFMFNRLSMFPGNLFVYFKFHSIRYIDAETRKSILIVLAGIISIGVIIIGLARPPQRTSTTNDISKDHLTKKKRGPVQALKKLWHMVFLKEIVALYFIYGATGLLLAFNHVVSASIGFTQHFGETRKRYIPLAGFASGLGGVIGAVLPFFFRTKKECLYLRPLTAISVLTITVGLLLSFLVLPDDALFGETSTPPYVQSNVYVALLISTLLGIGENSYTNEMTEFVGLLFPDDSPQAFAALLSLKNICVAIGFYISNYIGLYTQIYIMSIMTIIGTIGLTYTSYLLPIKKPELASVNGPPDLPKGIPAAAINSPDCF